MSDSFATLAGPSCERSSLPAWLRLVIMFGVLWTLKWLLPGTGLTSAVQVVVILAAATVLVWRLWWNCGCNRRGAIVMLGVLWAAGIARILLQ